MRAPASDASWLRLWPSFCQTLLPFAGALPPRKRPQSEPGTVIFHLQCDRIPPEDDS